MADEPRRSGRATKGQHTKNEEDELPVTASATKSQKPTKGKGGNKGKAAEEEEDEGGEDDSIIRCVCGATEDDAGWPMICCDKCEAWQHNLCMGLSEDEDELPEKYYCEQCRPSQHKELLQAIKRGEKPWEARIAAREEEERKKKRGKKGRKSGGGRDTPAKGTPVPVEKEEKKRKFEEAPPEIKKSASPIVSGTPTVSRRKSSAQVQPPDAKRRKSTVDGTHSRKSSVNIPTPASSFDELAKNRQPAVKAIMGKIQAVIDGFAKDGSYRVPDGETASSLASTLAIEIENALHAIYGDPTGYKAQFMAIFNNIPKNNTLVSQMLDGSLSPVELAEMSSDDMASEDVQRERAKAKEEADKQSILITEQGPRMRKTHKGDEMIGGDDATKAAAGGDDASWATRPVRRDTEDENMVDVDDANAVDSEDRVELPDDSDANRPALSVETKRKSSNYNMDRAWGAANSPTGGNGNNYTRAPVQPAAQGGRKDTQVADDDIDRLLKDEDEEDAVYSPAVDGSPGAPVWKGKVDMAGVASFHASAKWIAGGDVGIKIPYTTLLPPAFSITGRIAVQRADEYVSGMRFSQSNDVCCLTITPSSRRADQEDFAKIFQYFSEKGRWGVISGLGDIVRDAYLVTLPSGEGNLPEFMTMLEGNTALEQPRERDTLVLTLVVKTKSPLSTPAPQNAVSSTPVIPSQSPVIPPPITHNGTATVPILPPAINYPWATDLVRSILGPEIHAPAVVQLFSAVPDMTELQVRNLKNVLEREPSAREDLGRLGAALAEGAATAAQS